MRPTFPLCFALVFFGLCISICMTTNEIRLTKRELQASITKRTKLDTLAADYWLLNRNGLTEANLLKSEELLLRAQGTARDLLQDHASLMNAEKRRWLNDFSARCKQKRQRRHIADKECHAVLHYAKDINRKVFVLHKQLKSKQA
jgi:hypothetical protein